jgi:hypothetical protein
MREDHRDVRALAVRVEKLEAQNRRWKLLKHEMAAHHAHFMICNVAVSVETPSM